MRRGQDTHYPLRESSIGGVESVAGERYLGWHSSRIRLPFVFGDGETSDMFNHPFLCARLEWFRWKVSRNTWDAGSILPVMVSRENGWAVGAAMNSHSHHSLKTLQAALQAFRSTRKLAIAGALLGAGWTAALGGTFQTDFSADPGGTQYVNKQDITLIRDGVLKLIDLNDLLDENGNYSAARLPLQGSYILPDIDGDKKVAGFTATFKARIGGGSERPAQGFSFVLANDYPEVPFREAGGATTGLTISFDTYDSVAPAAGVAGTTEGNIPGDAPGIIVKQGGRKVMAKRFAGLRTDGVGSTTPVFVPVIIQLDADGTLDVTYNGTKVYDNVPIGYVPVAGRFGFGAGTEEITIAQRDNHWIDDVNITTTTVSGAHIVSVSPPTQDALPNAQVVIGLSGLGNGATSLKVDNTVVTPVKSTDGDVTTLTYTPGVIYAPGSAHTVELTYAGKTFVYGFTVLNAPVLPATAAVAANTVDTSKAGFRVRIHQTEAGQAENSAARAEAQLAGKLGDNIADLSAATGGAFDRDLINFEQDAIDAGDLNASEGHPDDYIPGIPGTTGSTDNIAAEVIGYLDLKPGVYTLGGVSDDSLQIKLGSDPRDVTALTLAETVLGRITGTILVQEAGIYPVRALFTEGGGGAGLELWSIDGTGKKVLLNDRTETTGIRSYRARSANYKVPPYLSAASPAPGEKNVPTRPKLSLKLTDDGTTVNLATVKVSINGTALTLPAEAVTRTAGVTTIQYELAGDLAPEAPQTLRLDFQDSAGTALVREYVFNTSKAQSRGGVAHAVKGYWTFDNGGLGASVGKDLGLIDSSLSGVYKFGTTGVGAFSDVPGINGKPAKVLYIPYTDTAEGNFKKIGLRMNHGIAPNGGGTKVNQWTVIMDVLWGENGPSGFAGVMQTHDLDNPGDADMFWRARDGSYGKSCCSSYDGLPVDKSHQRKSWARVIFSVDLAASPRVVGKYINGFKHLTTVTSNGDAIDSRFALPPEVFLFGDGDDNERTDCYVNSVQVREGRISDEQAAALGGPDADGIPMPYSQWEFDNAGAPLAARVGADLQYIDASLASKYQIGVTGQGAFADVPGINGQNVSALHIPYTETADGDFKKIGLRMKHGLTPNGGGAKVNQWTMIMDVLWGEAGPSGFAGVLQTHDLDNPGDADMFWRARDGSYGKSCCSSYDGLPADKSHQRKTWARVAFAIDLAASPRVVGKYINGVKHLTTVTSNGDAIDSRFALPPEIFLFGDGDDNERTELWVSSLQIREGRMSDDEIAALGAASADGIPTPNPVKGEWNFDKANLAATTGKPLTFIDASLSGLYKFGTTGEGSLADVPGINGKPATVLYVPYTDTAEGNFKKIGLRLPTGLAPSVGLTKANQWTLIMDVLWGANGPSGFAGVIQTHDLDNPGDADMFWRARDGSYGKSCCSSYDGLPVDKSHQRNAWARVIYSVDLLASPRVVAKYINGYKHLDKVTSNGDAVDSRFALPSEILVFGDGDDNERTDCYVSAIQIREGRITDEQAAALGAADATGIPGAPLGQAAVTPPPAIGLVGSDSVGGTYAADASAVVDSAAKTITVPIGTGSRFFRVSGAASIISVNTVAGKLVIQYQ